MIGFLKTDGVTKMTEYTVKRTLEIKTPKYGSIIRVVSDEDYITTSFVGENGESYCNQTMMLSEAKELAKVLCEMTGVYYED